MVSRLRFNPLLRMVLSHADFGMTKRASSGGTSNCVEAVSEFGYSGFPIVLGESIPCDASPGVIARGVIDTMNIVSDATKVSYKPRSAASDLILASTGGYIADFIRAQNDVLALVDAAAWRFDFLRPLEDTLGISDSGSQYRFFNQQLEEALVLSSTAVTNTTYLRTLSQILTLTDNARQAAILEAILDVLLLDHQATFQMDFLRLVSQNLGLSSASQGDVIFVRALETIMSLAQSGTVSADFVRAVEDLLLLLGDAERSNALIEAAATVLSLSDSGLGVWDFNRTDERSMSITDTVDDGHLPICEQLDWTEIGYDALLSPIYGFETAGFPIELGRPITSNINYWLKYQQCWVTNLETSEPPSPSYGAAGPTGLSATGKWRGGVLSQAGYVYFIPYDNLYTYKFDPSNNTCANLTTRHTGTLKWGGGGLGHSGNIVCAPNDATTILHINTSNDAETTFGTFTGTTKWMGVHVNKNGWAICVPRTSSQILAINPDSTANDVHLSTGPTTPGLACGQLAPDGVTVYCTPATSTAVLKLDTSNEQAITYRWLTGNYTGLNKWFGMVMEPESGNIYCVPYNSTTVLKIETNNNDYQTTFGSLTGNAKWVNGALAHDSRIYSGFWNATTALVIRTGNDSTFTFNTFNGGSAETCGVIALPDGRLIVVPADISAIPQYVTDASTSREADFLLSSYWNKL